MSQSDRQILGLGVFALVVLFLFFPRMKHGYHPAPADVLVDAAGSGQWDGVAMEMLPVMILAIPVGLFTIEMWRTR